MKTSPSRSLTLRILRQQSSHPQAKAYVQDYSLQCHNSDTILSLLHRILAEEDDSLTFRSSCGHAICGSCAMLIQGQATLACKSLVGSYRRNVISLSPLPGFPVIKDLLVDLSDFWAQLTEILPYLINDSDTVQGERLQSPSQQARIEEAARCILCACCTASCPSAQRNPDFIGPAALLKAWRFIADSRDQGSAQRLAILNHPHRLWRCHLIFECLQACPKDIDIPASISQLKRLQFFRGGSSEISSS